MFCRSTSCCWPVFPPVLWLLLRAPKSHRYLGGALRPDVVLRAGTFRHIQAAHGSSIRSPGNCCSFLAPGARLGGAQNARTWIHSPFLLSLRSAIWCLRFTSRWVGIFPRLRHYVPSSFPTHLSNRQDQSRCVAHPSLSVPGGYHRLYRADGLARAEIAVSYGRDHLRPTFAGDLLSWRVLVFCRPFRVYRFPIGCSCISPLVSRGLPSWSRLLSAFVV